MPDPLSKVFVGEDLFSEKMDNIAAAILGVAAGQGGDIVVKSWKEIQMIVRMGLARKFFSIGDILYVEKESAISASSTNGNLSVSVNAETFIEAIGEAGNLDYEAIYDGAEWHKENGESINLAHYGITITGTPVAEDKLVIHETADDIPMVVIGFDQETPVDSTRTHSMSLLMLNTFTGVVFCATQALFQFPDGLPAGNYSFSIASGYQDSYGGGSTIYFTLDQDIPAGGQLLFPWGYNTQASATKISTFASASATTAIEANIPVSTTDNGGTNLGTIANGQIQTVTAAGVTVKINNVERARYGSNNWEKSAIRQWCNSNAKKGSVWTPKDIFDRAPSWASTLDGFMHGLDPELVSVIGSVKKKTMLNTVTDGGSYITTEEKCWLMAMGEMGVSGFSSEGAQYEFYNKLLGGTIADWSTHTELIKTNKAGAAQYWWLRSPYTGLAHSARRVYPSGYVDNSHAYNGFQAVVGFAII